MNTFSSASVSCIAKVTGKMLAKDAATWHRIHSKCSSNAVNIANDVYVSQGTCCTYTVKSAIYIRQARNTQCDIHTLYRGHAQAFQEVDGSRTEYILYCTGSQLPSLCNRHMCSRHGSTYILSDRMWRDYIHTCRYIYKISL